MAKKEDYLEIFKMFDVNRDGYVSFDELLSALRKFGYKGNESALEACFKTSINTKKNKLNKEEFLQAMGRAPPIIHQVAMMRRIFTKLDLDNNGILDRKEMELALTYLGESFTKADMDNLMVIIDKGACRQGIIIILAQIPYVFGGWAEPVDQDKSNTIDLEEFINAFIHFEKK